MTDPLPRYWVDGVSGGTVQPSDRGLQYGDGLFETVAVRDGRPLRFERHIARLAAGCARIGIALPDIADEARASCTGAARAVLKITVTRGSGGRGYRAPAHVAPTRIVALHPWPEHPPQWAEQGVAVRWCDTRVAVQPALAGLKHLNRLEQVLARNEWNGDAWQEGLMCDTVGNVIEATQANLFIVRDGVLTTPALSGAGVAGIIRGMVFEAAQDLGVGCTEATLPRGAVDAADEAFLCNSIIGIWPIRQVGVVGLAAPGPVTAALQRWLAEHGDA